MKKDILQSSKLCFKQDSTNLQKCFEASLESLKKLSLPLVMAKETDDNIVYANNHFCHTFGLNQEEIIQGKPLSYLFESDDWGKVKQILQKQQFLSNYPIKANNCNYNSNLYMVSFELLTLQREKLILAVFHGGKNPNIVKLEVQEVKELLSGNCSFNFPLCSLHGMTYRRGKNGQIDFVGESCLDVTGYQRKELINNDAFSFCWLVGSEKLASINEQIEEQLKYNKAYSLEYKITTKDKQQKWVKDKGVGSYNDSGEIIFLEGVITDITEYKRNGEELYLLQTLTRVISKAPDFNGALTVVLQQLCETTGWDFGEAWLPSSDGKILEPSPAWFAHHRDAKILSLLKDFRENSEHYTFKLSEGLPGKVWASKEVKWIRDVSIEPSFLRNHLAKDYGLKAAVGVPIISDNQVVAILVFFMNQSRSRDRRFVELISSVATQLGDLFRRKQVETFLQESQRQLSSLVNSVPGIFFRTNNQPNLPIVYVSDGFQRLMGYSKEELILKRSICFDSLTHPEDLPGVKNLIDKSIKNRSPYVVEYRIKTKQGEEKWVWEKGQGIYDSDGQFLGLEGFISDISDRKQMEEAVRASEAELRGLLAAMKDVIIVLDNQGRYLKIAPTNPELLSKPVQELLGNTLQEVFEQKQADIFLQSIHKALESKKTVTIEYCLEIQQKSVWFEARISPISLDRVIWVARDITERKLAEKAIKEAEAKYRMIYENSIFGIFQTTPEGKYLSANPALVRIYGYDSPQKLIETLTDIGNQLYVQPNRRTEFVSRLRENNIISDFDSQVYHSSGKIIWISENARAVRDKEGNLLYYEGMVEDITYRIEGEKELHKRAYFDTLTGLPNRALFIQRLNEVLAQAKKEIDNYQFAVLFLDLDRFKVVNDSLGHLVGDQLLINIARKLEHCIRHKDTVARIGGDEFTILLDGIENLDQAIRIADRIKNELKAPFEILGHQVFTGVSIGIVSSQQYSEKKSEKKTEITPEALLRDADTALYRAKTLGKGSYQIFNSIMHQNVVALLELETDLRKALEAQEFQLHYQPIISLDTGKISGFESLLRWQHPRKGLIYPSKFIPVAEDTGLIIPLGMWVLWESCRQLREWQYKYPQLDLTINVNLSVKQFAQSNLLEEIDQVLTIVGLNPQNLKLEITESCCLNDEFNVIDTLRKLKERNIQLCIDDFGTGYSSLNYLHQLPIDVVKIDRSFISEIESNSPRAKIAKTIFNLAEDLGLKAVAEGIETVAQLEKIRTTRCQFGQGYLFSKPLVASEIELLLG